MSFKSLVLLLSAILVCVHSKEYRLTLFPDQHKGQHDCLVNLRVTGNTYRGEHVFMLDKKFNFIRDRTSDGVQVNFNITMSPEEVNEINSATLQWDIVGPPTTECQEQANNLELRELVLSYLVGSPSHHWYRDAAQFYKNEEGGPWSCGSRIKFPHGVPITIPRHLKYLQTFRLLIKMANLVTDQSGDCPARLTLIGTLFSGNETTIYDQKVNMKDLKQEFGKMTVKREGAKELREIKNVTVSWTPDKTSSPGCIAQAQKLTIEYIRFGNGVSIKFARDRPVDFRPNTLITLGRQAK